MKKFAIGFAIVVAILMGAVLIIPGFLNWNKYRGQIEQTASYYSGRNVKIRGKISLSLLPTSALSAQDVSVTNLAGGHAENMLSLKSLDIRVSFPSVIASFFGGKIKVRKFILVNPVVALEVLKDGRVNWDMIRASQAAAGTEVSSADISFDNFQIINGQISFENMSSGRKELLKNINASVKIKSIMGPFNVEGTAKYNELDAELSFKLGKNRPGRKIPVTVRMSLLNGQVKANMIGGVSVSAKAPVFSGSLKVTAMDFGDFYRVINRITGRKSLDEIRFGQDFALDTGIAAGLEKAIVRDLNVRLGQSRGQGKAEISLGKKINFQASLSVNKLDMNKIMAAYKTSPPDSDRTKTKGTGGSDIATGWLNRLSGGVTVKLGALRYNGKIASQIMAQLSASDGVVDITTLRGRMPGGSNLSFTGQVAGAADKKPVLTGDITLSTSNLRGLLSWIKLEVTEVPSGQLTLFSARSGLKLTPDLLQLYSLKGKLDAMSFNGGVSYALEGRPSYGVSLNIRNLNLDFYRQTNKGADKGDDTGKQAWQSDLRRSLAVLDKFDARYRVTLKNFTLYGVKIRSGELDGLLLGGRLDAKKIALTDIAGINLVASGRGRNFAESPEVRLKLSANAKSLLTLKRTLRFEKFFNSAPDNTLNPDQMILGQMQMNGTVSASFEKMDMDIKSRIGTSDFDIRGTIRSTPQKTFPDIGGADMYIDIKSASLTALIDQFNLPLISPGPGDDHPVRIKGHLASSPEAMTVDGGINIAAGKILIKGQFKGKTDAINMTVDVQGPDTREFIRGLGINFQPASRKPDPVSIKFSLTGSRDHYALNDIVGEVGAVKLSGSGTINLTAPLTYFDFNLKAGDIPLQNFLTKNTLKMPGKMTGKYGQWAHLPMDLSLLSAYNGRVRISANSLRYNSYIFKDPVFGAVLTDGVLSINDFTGRLFGGRVILSGSLDSNDTPEMTVNISLKQASLPRATTSLAGIAPVTGYFDLSGKFTSNGISQYDMISALSGTGKLITGPGMISGIDIAALSSRISAINSNDAFARLLKVALYGGKTSYKGGISTIVAKKGRIAFSPFDSELDGAKGRIKMDLDLPDWTIRSTGRLSLSDHPHAPPIAVTIAGNITAPDISFNTARLRKYVGEKVASHMLKKLVGSEGNLEGIFGNGSGKKKAPPKTTPRKSTKKPVVATPVVRQPSQSTQKPADKSPVDKLTSPDEFGKRLLQKLLDNNKKAAANKSKNR